MFHGLSNNFLYSAYRLECAFTSGEGQTVTCSGTGFWVNAGDSGLFLITNRHVLDIGLSKPEFRGFELSQLRILGKRAAGLSELPDIDQEWEVTDARVLLSEVEKNDIACVVNPNVVAIGSNTALSYPLPLDLLATKEDFQTKFSVCDFLAFPGFPEWHDKRQRRPILRTGTIASDPRSDYSWTLNYEGECIAYEAFSYGGSSGSPVFAVPKGIRLDPVFEGGPGFRELKLIGINAGHLYAKDKSHSGISYMYKASAILDIIENYMGNQGVSCNQRS